MRSSPFHFFTFKHSSLSLPPSLSFSPSFPFLKSFSFSHSCLRAEKQENWYPVRVLVQGASCMEFPPGLADLIIFKVRISRWLSLFHYFVDNLPLCFARPPSGHFGPEL